MSENNHIILKIYRDENNRELITEWIESIKDVVTQVRIRTRLSRLEIGNFGDCKSVGAGVFELRLQFGPGFRVYYGKVGDTVVLLLCGGEKKSQEKDIKIAKEYWKNYIKLI